MKIPRSDGHPLGWGCGDSKVDNAVPDKPMGFDFQLACRRHDVCCSDKNGPEKSICDGNFKSDMKKECSKYWWYPRGVCESVADFYHFMVDKPGGVPFENARK